MLVKISLIVVLFLALPASLATAQEEPTPAIQDKPAGVVQEKPQASVQNPTPQASANPALARTWADSSGTYEIQAELVKLDGEVVHLKKADGTIIKVPLSKLCLGDRRFIQQQLAAKATAGPKADSEVGSGTGGPASAQDAPPRAATDSAREKQKQEQLLATQQKRLERLQDLLQQAKAMPVRSNYRGSSRTPYFTSKQAKEKRLAMLQTQIDQLQQQIESVEAKTADADSANTPTSESDKTATNAPIPHLNRYTPVLAARETDQYPLTIRLMADKVLTIFRTPAKDRALETRRLVRVAIRAEIPDRTLSALVLQGIHNGKSKGVDAFTAAQVVRESLEFIAACGYRGPPVGAVDVDHPRIGGDWDALRDADEILRFSVMKSEVFNQLATTVRIGNEVGFKDSTEAAELFRALKEGRPCYRFKTRNAGIRLSSIYFERRWLEVMEEGSGLSGGAPISSDWLGDHSANAASARNWPLIALARTLQWKIDVGPNVQARVLPRIAFLNTRLSRRAEDEVAGVFVELIRGVDRSESRDRMALSARLNAGLKDKVVGKRISLAERDIPKYTDSALSAAENFARTVGYESLASMLALHNSKYLFAVTSTFDSEEQDPAETQERQ